MKGGLRGGKLALLGGKTKRIFVARLLEDEDLIEGIRARAEEAEIKAGMLLLIGSLKEAVLGFYDKGKYKNILIAGPLEIASCVGNIAVDENGETVVHAHLVVSNEKGQAFGGHLMKKCHVGATAELIMIEVSDVDLRRMLDGKTNLKLLKLD